MDLLSAAWTLEFHSGIPVYKQIVHRVEAEIAGGRLGEGDQLPSIRALHQKLNVNPNTVARAYLELANLGLITTEHGSGCFVAAQPEVPTLPARKRQAILAELSTRFAAEARGHGISLDELVQHINQRKSNV
jgi:GntR family transcriptional regulator